MNDLMKIAQALEDSNTLVKEVTKTIKNETKKTKIFFSILLGTLVASLLGNLLAAKGIVKAGTGNKKPKGIIRADITSIPPHPLKNFEIACFIGLLYFVTEVKLFISIVLVLNKFLKKLKNLPEIKI